MILPRHPKFLTHLLLTVAAPALALMASCNHHSQKSAQKTTAVCTLPADSTQLPDDLTTTACFTPNNTVASNMYGYDVIAPLWADGGDKGRWLVLPNGASTTFDTDGVLQLPTGGGIFKEFAENGVRLETRLLFKDSSGKIQAASWAWNAAQNSTTLLSVGESLTLDGETWNYPSPAQCAFCHNAVAGTLLGARFSQINRPADDGNISVDQIGALTAEGAISGTRPTTLSTLVDPQGASDGNLRARSYLAANCSYCHQPNGASGTATDFRYDTPLSGMGICGVAPTAGDLGITGAKLLDAGSPNTSIISYRVHSVDAGTRMPPVGRTLEDITAAALIDEWIQKMTVCP